MIKPDREVLTAFNSNIANLLSQIKINKKQMQEDLLDVELPLPTGKVCDFGCGLGFTTYSLSSILRATETIGVDIDSSVVAQSSKWFEAIKLHIQFQSENTLPDDFLHNRLLLRH